MARIKYEYWVQQAVMGQLERKPTGEFWLVRLPTPTARLRPKVGSIDFISDRTNKDIVSLTVAGPFTSYISARKVMSQLRKDCGINVHRKFNYWIMQHVKYKTDEPTGKYRILRDRIDDVDYKYQVHMGDYFGVEEPGEAGRIVVGPYQSKREVIEAWSRLDLKEKPAIWRHE
jgi:hypothetical protein